MRVSYRALHFGGEVARSFCQFGQEPGRAHRFGVARQQNVVEVQALCIGGGG